VDPIDNLDLAKFLEKLKTGPPDEAKQRAACGRAYYAAFGVVRDLLLAIPLSVPRDGTAHGHIISALKRSTRAEVAAVGGLLDQLRTTRNRADYHVGTVRPIPVFTNRDSQFAILFSSQIINDIEGVAKVDRRLGL